MTEQEKARGLAIAKAALPGAVWVWNQYSTDDGYWGWWETRTQIGIVSCNFPKNRKGWYFSCGSICTADQLRDRIRRDALAQLALLGASVVVETDGCPNCGSKLCFAGSADSSELERHLCQNAAKRKP